MNPNQHKIEQLIQHLGQTIKADLQLKSGVCALYNAEGLQAVVLEIPDHSDTIVFHCSLFTLPDNLSRQTLRQLLLLNFEISAMQGCWLAADERDNLCLCYVLEIDKTDEQHFTNSVLGFIEQVKDVRAFTHELVHELSSADVQ